MAERQDLPPIRFNQLADALLSRISELVPAWLPGGVQRGNEYVCASLSGGSGGSCSVNMGSGKWADFSGDERGNDLISLYAAIHCLGMGKAALQLAQEHGLEDVAGVQHASGAAPAQPKPVREAPAPKPKPKSDEGWEAVRVVPANAPPVNFKHQFRAEADIQHVATYQTEDGLHGYVVRFLTSDGGKDTIARTWCTSARDGASRWHWKQFAEPRPLYFPGALTPIALAAGYGGSLPTVVLVEGERKADLLHTMLAERAPGVYLVATWPGGCKAWKKSDWTWINGCHVLLWPDCDGKREKLTKAEEAQCGDDAALEIAKAMKPLLPENKQVGMVAMLGIGAQLRDAHACTVQLLPIPQPLEVKDGWDCADAIESDGWDFDRVLAFFGKAQPLPADAVAADQAANGGTSGGTGGTGGGGGGKNRDGHASAGGDDSGGGDSDGGDGDDAFASYLDYLCGEFKCKVHDLGVNRKMLIAALRKAPSLKDCLGLNELTGAPSTKVPWPWRTEAGPLAESDALRFGDYLCDKYKIKAASKAALDEAIETVADERRFHPIQNWLKNDIEHDGVKRIDKWLIYVLGKHPDQMSPKLRRYLELVGRYMLMGLVARVMEPGCKFDYSPVFEGLTGRGKSTFVKTLVGEKFFSDTPFDIGKGKDGMEQLEGLWAYELSELTPLRNADSEQIKAFFSSTVDRFRGAYGKYVQSHPRQCVIFCSTNKKQYLYDLTGNRRFWPMWIDQFIKLDWLKKFRNQLFAEAYDLYKAGERYTPTYEEEVEFFIPEQRKRLVETAVQSRLYELLTREGAGSGEGKISNDINMHTEFVTLDRLVAALGTDAAKSTNSLEGQIRGWLDANGWEYGRESTGQRRRGYKQPKAWPPKFDDDDEAAPDAAKQDGPAQGETNGDDDYAPF
jgi:predicted P-loop ATPase/uncharacterized membrane protein YgcG